MGTLKIFALIIVSYEFKPCILNIYKFLLVFRAKEHEERLQMLKEVV